MIGHTNRQASLFFFAFAKEVSAIKDIALDYHGTLYRTSIKTPFSIEQVKLPEPPKPKAEAPPQPKDKPKPQVEMPVEQKE